MTEKNNINNSWNIKSRYLLLIFILSFIVSIIFSLMFLGNNPTPISDVLFGYVLYGSLLFFIYVFAKKASIDWKSLIGEIKVEYFTSKYILIIIPLIAISLASIFLFYYPLSFWFPDFVEYWVLDDEINLIWFEGDNYKLANALSFFNVIIIAPIIEEIFFRGFLLTSLAKKWDIKKAIILSSIFFGLFHADIIGGIVFGIVASILYLKTRSLFAPIILHISNNSVAFILMYFFSLSGNNDKYTLTDFQGDWWIGLVGFIIELPWFIYFYKKEILRKFFQVPYFCNARV